jgi:hypothetical protein
MRVRRFLMIVACAVLLAGPAAIAYGQTADSPIDCDAPNVICDEGSGGDGGIPDGFVAIAVLIGIAGIGLTIWRVSTARQMAREAGMDPGRATTVTLLGDDGLDATYIATSLRGRAASATSTASPPPSAADRLRELEQLREDGLVTAAEYDARRRAIVDSL